jgi:glycyl-tRNA synthetase
MGIAARGNFDLTQHSEHSGKNLEYFDSANDIKYLPHVIEPSLGVERLFLALLVSNYKEESLPNNDKRTVLSLPPALAPIKVAVFPLLSNKVELQAFAKTVAQLLRSKYVVEFDSSGAIGRRYRRADEIGIPFCVTIDFDSLKDNTVTIRYRDSMEQRRINVDEILTLLGNEIVE